MRMNYDISDAEQVRAEKCLDGLDKLILTCDAFQSHLDKIQIPFKENQDITPEQIWKFRSVFRNYRDEAKIKFLSIQEEAFKCSDLLNEFSSDTQVEKMISSFDGCMEDLSQCFDDFCETFDAMQAKEFKELNIAAIDKLNKKIKELKQLIDERVAKFMQNDILDSNWYDKFIKEKEKLQSI